MHQMPPNIYKTCAQIGVEPPTRIIGAMRPSICAKVTNKAEFTVLQIGMSKH